MTLDISIQKYQQLQLQSFFNRIIGIAGLLKIEILYPELQKLCSNLQEYSKFIYKLALLHSEHRYPSYCCKMIHNIPFEASISHEINNLRDKVTVDLQEINGCWFSSLRFKDEIKSV